jgi:hypothetical protein
VSRGFDALLQGEVGFKKETLSHSMASGSTDEGELMSKKVSRKKALANPVELNPFSADKGQLRVVIETPKGSRNKFAFNEEERTFELK